MLTADSSYAIRARVTLKNTGSADIPLRVTLLTVAPYAGGDVDEHGRPTWPEVARAHAFTDHDSIESQETIIDDLLIPLRKEHGPERENVLGYRVMCQAYERRMTTRLERVRKLLRRPVEETSICWTTKTVVPADLEEPSRGEDQ